LEQNSLGYVEFLKVFGVLGLEIIELASSRQRAAGSPKP